MKNYLLVSMLFCGTQTLSAQNFIDKTVGTFNILFGVNKAEIQNQYYSKLDSLANSMIYDTIYRIKIKAHTDNTGSETHNAKLSQARAAVIQNYLTSKGIDNQRFTTDWKGEFEPIADNQTEEGKMQNRRVTVDILRRIYLAKVTSVVKNDSGVAVANAFVRVRSRYLTDSTRTDSSGTFTMNVPFKQPIILEVTAKGHFYDKQMLHLGVFNAQLKDFLIVKAEVGRKIKIKDLNFYGNQAKLLPESLPNLKIIVLFMQANPTFKIEIGGHVNVPGAAVPVNSWDWNLSLGRAKTVYDYLIEHGMDAKRLIFKGYGNSVMLFPIPFSDAEHAANRRVEIRVLEK
jgi:outer membrane protein OmpA-like peptidoglycan-associated protein